MTTMVTRLFTWRKGELVGEDEFGNRYYRERATPAPGMRWRRWVVYRGEDEASKVPPGWHAWLHHMSDAPPDEAASGRRPWQKPHLPNLTGTTAAYRPPGDLAGKRPEGMPPPYQPWRP
ncbi:MAG: NADH:ubiquinone oxidoreductase subunit NDUFA12 [Alphaproteobacteria bacterium]